MCMCSRPERSQTLWTSTHRGANSDATGRPSRPFNWRSWKKHLPGHTTLMCSPGEDYFVTVCIVHPLEKALPCSRALLRQWAMYQYYDGQVTQSLKLVLVLRVKLSDILFLSLCSLDSTGPEIITCYGLREIGSLICILFTHRRQLNAIFFTQFHATRSK